MVSDGRGQSRPDYGSRGLDAGQGRAGMAELPVDRASSWLVAPHSGGTRIVRFRYARHGELTAQWSGSMLCRQHFPQVVLIGERAQNILKHVLEADRAVRHAGRRLVPGDNVADGRDRFAEAFAYRSAEEEVHRPFAVMPSPGQKRGRSKGSTCCLPPRRPERNESGTPKLTTATEISIGVGGVHEEATSQNEHEVCDQSDCPTVAES